VVAGREDFFWQPGNQSVRLRQVLMAVGAPIHENFFLPICAKKLDSNLA
jgi:hypothetical protein